MTLNAELCYRALRTRDARFDGRFFTAVLTTGIYCRPVCPARTPRRKNVRFYPCSAAAEEAGYRPCRRCRPESAPGTPTWIGTSAVVAQGLRLISQGFLDEGSVKKLATTLSVSSRHLRRLFIEHLGASPVVIAHTRRVHFAKKLIDETDLTMAQVAFSSGFSSIRRFNDAMRECFARSPTELRQAAGKQSTPVNDVPLELRLSFRPPYQWQSILQFLRDRATPGVESASDHAYRRTIALDGVSSAIEVRPVDKKNELSLRVSTPGSEHLMKIVERVRSIFDLGADPQRISAHLKRHAAMARLVDAFPGLRVPGAWSGFELAVRAILGQQVSVSAATTLAGRLAAEYGERLEKPHQGGLTRLFPPPKALAKANLTGFGIPRTRAQAICALAARVRDGEITFDASLEPTVLRERLEAVPGIGSWTAAYIAMRSLREPDAFPSGDLGLRKAAGENGRPLTPRRLERMAETWRPWRAYAAMYLWKSHSTQAIDFDSGRISMLEMKHKCQKCDASLPVDAKAYICSFECTFCAVCASEMELRCPNCGGELVRRPRREKEE